MTEGVLETRCPGFSGSCQDWGFGDIESTLVNRGASHHQLAGKYNMIGAWPNIRWFSHSGCCLGRMSRRLLMTLVCHQVCLGELSNGLVRWYVRKKMEEVEKRIEVKRRVELPSPAAITTLHFHTARGQKIW